MKYKILHRFSFQGNEYQLYSSQESTSPEEAVKKFRETLGPAFKHLEVKVVK